MEGGCFRVYKVGNCFYYYNDQIPEFSGELDRDYWTARSVKKGRTSELRTQYFMIRFLVTLRAFLIMAGAANAQWVGDLEPLTGESLKNTFSGKTMDGIYKQPRERTGTNQFTETFKADGSTQYIEGPISDNGFWAVTDDVICFRYTGPLSGNVSCFVVFKTGTCLYSYNPSAIKADGMPYDPNLWSVKTIIRGDVSTCDNLVS